jgi:hypothetical protein
MRTARTIFSDEVGDFAETVASMKRMKKARMRGSGSSPIQLATVS